MKKIFCILLVGLLLFATGCQEIVTEIEVSDDTPETTDITTVMEDTATTTTSAKPVMKKTTAKPTTTTTTKNPVILDPTVLFYPFKDNTIVYHWIDADAFYNYLENPSEKVLLAGSHICNTALKVGDRLIDGWTRVLPKWVEFISSKKSLTDYLSGQGIQVDVQAAALLQTDIYLPLIILVKTDKDPVFITIDEKKAGKKYEYMAYTLAEFREKLKMRVGKMIIEGKDVSEQVTVKLYYRNAEISLFEALEAMGATIEKLDEKTFKIRYLISRFTIELEDGMYYKENGHYMVNVRTFNNILLIEDEGWNVTVDMDAEAVIVDWEKPK